MRDRVFAALSAVIGVAVMALPAASADLAHGKSLFAACIACHTETSDAAAPSLKGVFGRKAGSLEDFRYSSAMKRADFVWDAANLRDYLHDPQARVKGNHMPFSGYDKISDAQDVAAYLEAYK